MMNDESPYGISANFPGGVPNIGTPILGYSKRIEPTRVPDPSLQSRLDELKNLQQMIIKNIG